MDLGEVLKTHLDGDQQGQLVIKFAGEKHLCKISVENGQAIYLTLGTMGPEDTLNEMVGKVAEWTNFIKGMPARKRLDTPITQLLLNIAEAAPLAEGEIPLAATTDPDESTLINVVHADKTIDAAQIKIVLNRFVDLVGPLASILIEKICSNLAYTEGSSMNSATYSRFISALAAEVPESDKQDFINAAAL
jgi:hypothetical protein